MELRPRHMEKPKSQNTMNSMILTQNSVHTYSGRWDPAAPAWDRSHASRACLRARICGSVYFLYLHALIAFLTSIIPSFKTKCCIFWRGSDMKWEVGGRKELHGRALSPRKASCCTRFWTGLCAWKTSGILAVGAAEPPHTRPSLRDEQH